MRLTQSGLVLLRNATIAFILAAALHFTVIIKAHSEAKSTTDIIIATVNGEAIKASDYDRTLKLAAKNQQLDRITDKFRKEVLDEMINLILIERYLTQQGETKNPDLQAEIRISRQALLKNYFLAQALNKPITLKIEEVDKFAADRPDFFKDRKTFYYTDIRISKENRVDLPRLKAIVMTANRDKAPAEPKDTKISILKPVIGYLEEIMAVYKKFQGFRSSENIEKNVLEDLKLMTVGKVFVDDSSDENTIHVLALHSVAPDPVNPVEVRGEIAKGIVMERKSAEAKKLIEELRQSSDVKIGYQLVSNKTGSEKSKTQKTQPQQNSGYQTRLISVETLRNIFIFSLCIFFPFSIFHIHRRNLALWDRNLFNDHSIYDLIGNRLTLLSINPFFEILSAIIAAVLLLATSILILSSSLVFPNYKLLVVEAVIGITASGFVVFSLKKFGKLLPTWLTEKRYLPISIIFFVQGVFLSLALSRG